ncbi:14117_t:CDS:2, partial [Entrophospora sp. SA101]
TIKIEQITTDKIIESLNQSDLIQMVLDKVNNENNESESEDIDEPKIIVTIANVLKAVDTLIEYFQHQNDLEFNENDYKNLKKYKINI